MGFEEFSLAEKQGWNERATIYDDVTGQVTTQAIPALLALAGVAPGKRVLDLCCGTGRAAGAAAALGAHAEGIDFAPAMVERARKAFPALKFDVGDAEAIPLEDSTFDAVVCSFGLFHLADAGKALKEIARVLRPGGRAALSHWVGPPTSDFFRAVFGVITRHADMSVAPPAPPPFALSSEEAMKSAMADAGFSDVQLGTSPVVFSCPAGRFAETFRAFAGRTTMVLDRQSPEVREAIVSAWDKELEPYIDGETLRVPMPAMTVSGVRPN
jgi:SAM-dependent methyltransferase